MDEIVLIAPYEKMRDDALHVIRDNDYTNVGIKLGDLTDGIIAASRAVEEGARVLISRGGTYSLIKYVSPVPVVEIKISALDMVDTIKTVQSAQKTVAFVGYGSVTGGYELLRQFGKEVIKVELDHKDDVATKIKACGKSGETIIIGDAVTCRIGRELGYTCCLLESGAKSLQNAFEEAFRMLQAVEREQELLNRYRTLTDSVHDAVLAVDEQNTVIAINRPACRIFGLPQEEFFGKKLDALYDYGSVIQELAEGVVLTDELRQIGVTKIEISNYPIKINGRPHGSIAVFQDITEVQSREKNIRLKLVEKGFVAKYSFNTIIYKSSKMADCIRIAKKISSYDSAVLIEGESGTGKELFAQSIHNDSRRRPGVIAPLAPLWR